MKTEVKNKLYTRSYAIKRLRSAGFRISTVDIKFTEKDLRYWMIIVNPNIHNILITCYLDKNNKTNFYFKIHSHLNTINIKTKSMLILIDGIKKLISELDIQYADSLL
jgi:hypothetical protein